MSESGRQASILLRKAGEDLYAATCLGKDPAASLWTVGFHAQQAVEKALKSVLMRQGIRYPFTHDIEVLTKIVRQAALPLPPDSENLPYLTPFGTLYRYEDETWGLPESLGMVHLLRWAEGTVSWAEGLLPGHGADTLP